MTKLVQAAGAQNIWALRVGTTNGGEVGYPTETSDPGHENDYWAYDANAQGRAADLPGTLAPAPFPGWHPGDQTYNGQPFTPDMARQWYAWYYSALADDLNWQIATYRNAGFAGQIHIVMSGLGARPDDETGAYQVLLNGTGGDSDAAMGVGASYHEILPEIANKQGVLVDISSVDDSSAAYQRQFNNWLCTPTDGQVALSDPQVDNWDSTRWLSYLARKNGFATIGENPDDSATNPAYGVQMMQDAATLMQSCGLGGLLWAHDHDLFDGQHGVALSDYATVISQYNK